MPKLFVGNFSFEQTRNPANTLPTRLRRLDAELASVWLAVADEEDEILCAEPIDDEYWTRMQELGCPRVHPISRDGLTNSRARKVIPWGWSEEIRTIAVAVTISCDAPDQNVIWNTNSREFQFELARELGCLIPGETLIRSIEEIDDKLRRTGDWPAGWILKANWGQSGRGQMSGVGLRDDPPFRDWVRRNLGEAGFLVLEPRLNAVSEYGIQWEVPRTGPPTRVGITELLSDRRGQYLGTTVLKSGDTPELLHDAIVVQSRVAERLQLLGYFGPLGIDTMIYRDDSGMKVRPVQDINARWTMGRLALGWAAQLQSVGVGSWLHQSESPSDTAILLSPERVGSELVRHRHWWQPAASTTSLIQDT